MSKSATSRSRSKSAPRRRRTDNRETLQAATLRRLATSPLRHTATAKRILAGEVPLSTLSYGQAQAELDKLVDLALQASQTAATTPSTADTREVAGPTPAVNIPIPTITFVHYANRSYQHVNGEIAGSLSPEQAHVAQRTAEALEATGAVRVAEIDLRHLTV